jgi:hypothetical protein
MDSELVQRTRYLLQARVRTAKSCPDYVFLTACRHLRSWLFAHPLVAGIIAPLQPAVSRHYQRIRELANLVQRHANVDTGQRPSTEDLADLASIGLAVLQLIGEAGSPDGAEARVAYWYLGSEKQNPRGEEYPEAIRDVAIEALYQFVDEKIDERNVTLALLHKYKARCEWFRRERLREAATGTLEGRTGERALAIDLYEYMHDQGVDFHAEPLSSSGRPDVVSERVKGTRLVMDAKWIAPDSAAAALKDKIVRGFAQMFSYLRDYEEPVGYLSIFNAADITPDIEAEQHDGFACVTTAGRSVYYVTIDLHAHATSASKRPVPQIVRVTKEEIIEELSGHPTPES